MFIMTQEDLACQVPVFTHQYNCPSTILINESYSSYPNKGYPVKIIIHDDKIIRYSNASTQIDSKMLNENNQTLLKNVSTVTDYNISNSRILNENQNPEFIKLNNFNENDNINFSDDDDMLSNESEEEDYDEEVINNGQPLLYNNFVPPNVTPNPNILFSPNNLNSDKSLLPTFREKTHKKNRICLTPEARKFRDSFYRCYGDRKRFSKLFVRNIHNSICGALGLPRMTRAEYRSILLYFNNYAPYRQKIIQAINMKRGFILNPLDSANAKLFGLR